MVKCLFSGIGNAYLVVFQNLLDPSMNLSLSYKGLGGSGEPNSEFSPIFSLEKCEAWLGVELKETKPAETH